MANEKVKEKITELTVVSKNIKNFGCWEFKNYGLTKKEGELVQEALDFYSAYLRDFLQALRAENTPCNEENH